MAGGYPCGCCGRECAICDTNQVPEYLDIEFGGLADVYCNVQITCPDPGTTSSTLILPLSAINGTHRLTLDRTITETYYPDGEPASACTAVYVSEIIPFGDAFVGFVSGCDGSTAPIDNEDNWYRDATVQLIGVLNDERIIIGSICDTTDPADPSFLILANTIDLSPTIMSSTWACSGDTIDITATPFVANFAAISHPDTSGNCLNELTNTCAPGAGSVTLLTVTASPGTTTL